MNKTILKTFIIGALIFLSLETMAGNTSLWPSSGDRGIGAANAGWIPATTINGYNGFKKRNLYKNIFGTAVWRAYHNAATPFLGPDDKRLKQINNSSVSYLPAPLYSGNTSRETEFISLNPANPILVLHAASGQTADLLQFRNAAGTTVSVMSESGNMGIGVIAPTEKLSVLGNASIDGNIVTRKVTVTQSGWPDYVFDPSYSLRPLSEVARFIKVNQHLPEIPSAKEVAEKGVNLGENQALLLKKIEELTLYIISMKEEMEQLKKRLDK